MHLIRSHRRMYVQVPQVVTNLILSYSERDFAPLVPVYLYIHLRGVGRDVSSEDRGKNVVEYLSLLLVHCYQFASCVHPGGTLSLTFLFWLTYLFTVYSSIDVEDKWVGDDMESFLT